MEKIDIHTHLGDILNPNGGDLIRQKGIKKESARTSQSPGRVKELLFAFGPDRVMYASDWPYGNQKPSIRVIKNVCAGDYALERRLCDDNAAELLFH